MRLGHWSETLNQDVKFAFRQLRAAPLFTAIAVTTLALGIGANSAIFALVDATLLRPLPYATPDRLVTIWETSDASSRSFASAPNMLDWNGRSRTFEQIAGFTPTVGGMVMAGRDGNAETVSRQWVTVGLRPDLRAHGSRSQRRHHSHGAVDDRPRRRPDASGEGGDFTDRQGAAGQHS